MSKGEGGGSAGAGSGANQLVDLLSAKTARDLSLDMSMQKGTQHNKLAANSSAN
jgi:hypothetical protein